MILPETDLEGGRLAAERVRRLIEHLPLRPGGPGSPPVTISLGVSAAPVHAALPTGLVHAADSALYQAKARGKNQVVVFEDALVISASPSPSETAPG